MSFTYSFDREKAIRLLTEFIHLETVNPPGHEKIGAEFLASELRDFGLDPGISDLGSGRANVTAVLRGSGKSKALIYNGHIDVVPVGKVEWIHPPFSGEVVNGRLYGRGSSDMKSGVAAMLMAIGILAQQEKQYGKKLRGNLVFSAVADEEVSGFGANHFVLEGGLEGAGAVIFIEPTGFKAYISEKGVYWVEIETIGKTAHGAMPHLGRNAILDMQAVIEEVMKIPLPMAPDPKQGKATLNIGTIKGGVSANVVPDSCKVNIDLRLPPGLDPESVFQEFRDAIKRAELNSKGLKARITATGERVPVATSPESPIVRTVIELCREMLDIHQAPLPTPGYATDASILCRDRDLPFVIIGPGREELAHKPDEYVLVEEYLKAIDFYCALAERYLGSTYNRSHPQPDQ